MDKIGIFKQGMVKLGLLKLVTLKACHEHSIYPPKLSRPIQVSGPSVGSARPHRGRHDHAKDCSGQLIPDSDLDRFSALAGATPSLNVCGLRQL